MPTKLRNKVIAEQHKLLIHEHQGQQKILERINRYYYFLHMRKLVEEHLQKRICHWTKNGRHFPYGELQSLQIPERAWNSVLLNFMIKLPLFKESMIRTEFDSIFIVVNRLTKWETFIPYKKLFIVENLVYIFLR